MNHTKYEILYNLPKTIFSFILSTIICILVFGQTFLASYLLVPANSINPIYFISSEMFVFISWALVVFLVHSTIYSLIYCCINIWMIDDDYEKNKYVLNGESISKSLFFKLQILKHVPLFSILNGFMYFLTGKSILQRVYNVTYSFDNNSSFTENVLRKYILIIIFFFIFQLIGSSVIYIQDQEIKMDKYLESLEVIKNVDEEILYDSLNDEIIYNLVIYLEDGYIHFNKMTYAKEEIQKELHANIDFIKDKYAKRYGDISTINVIIYNDYTKTWDKYMYNHDLTKVYAMENISSNINDIDIYIRDNTLVYNILTNLSKDEIGWDMAEFILSEFEADITNPEMNEEFKEILNVYDATEKYVINILSKEYFTSKNNSYFVYVKNIEDADWFYYDNKLYSLAKKEQEFESLVLTEYDNISFDFKNLYDTGEIHIITEKAIDIDKLYKLLDESYEGKQLKNQVKYIGKSNKIKFIVEEGIS